MTQAAKGQEPSMEEILASIRRIIADDDPARTAPKEPVPPPRVVPPPRMAEPEVKEEEIDTMLAQLQATSQPEPAVEEEPASDILDLTEQMATSRPAVAPAFRTIDGQSDLVFEDNPVEPPPPPPPPRVEEPRPVLNGGDRGLISATTSAAVDSAFNTLAQTVLVQNGRTLEDLVREMLRPMLKTWLYDNLPSMVERLVRAEIERVSRGRG
jgi:uncharacterized protein